MNLLHSVALCEGYALPTFDKDCPENMKNSRTGQQNDISSYFRVCIKKYHPKNAHCTEA